ncbi:WYL domain-containing protein [Vibrio aestuarianus]|nr:WYL domain-containing protein [Vibrio aestuarianus]CAK2554776.1 WYL domain-containing protein [Vibrio crassostreae]CAK3688527.1 WYL domain-containing protein [Vibrio crassostreae]
MRLKKIKPSMDDTKLNRSQHYIQLVLEIYKRIPNSRKITAKEIQLQLSEIGIARSERTIQRNLTDIAQFFDDVDVDTRDKPFGYSRRSQNLLSHGPQEAVLLSLAENYLRYLLPVNLMKTLDSVFNDAKQHLFPTTSNMKERQWLRKVCFVNEGVPLLPPHIDNKIFEKVSYALFHNRYLSICYTNANLEYKSKDVMPLGLAQQGSRLYLVCRFHGHTNERSLALHRINKVNVSTFDFTYPSDFDLERYELDGRFYFGEGNEVNLSFCITHESGYHLLETPLSLKQCAELVDGGYQITATVIDSPQLDRWLRGFGDDVWDITKQKSSEKTA